MGSLADAVVRRRAMQARVEVEVGFVGRVRPGSEDGRKVAAGGHAESVDEIARRPAILLLHVNATAVGQHEGSDVGLLAQPTFDRLRPIRRVRGWLRCSSRRACAWPSLGRLPPPRLGRSVGPNRAAWATVARSWGKLRGDGVIANAWLRRSIRRLCLR
jgi:hypothetical protein